MRWRLRRRSFPGRAPRSVRGRPSGLQAARASPAATALRAGLDPGDLGGPWAAGIKGQAGGLPLPAHGTLPAPAAYGEHGKRHLPALLQRPVEPKDVDGASMSYPRSWNGRPGELIQSRECCGNAEAPRVTHPPVRRPMTTEADRKYPISRSRDAPGTHAGAVP